MSDLGGVSMAASKMGCSVMQFTFTLFFFFQDMRIFWTASTNANSIHYYTIATTCAPRIHNTIFSSLFNPVCKIWVFFMGLNMK